MRADTFDIKMEKQPIFRTSDIKKAELPEFMATPFETSTIVAIGRISENNVSVDAVSLFTCCDDLLVNPSQLGFIYAEFCSDKKIQKKGYHPTKKEKKVVVDDVAVKPKKKNSAFDNQLTLLLHFRNYIVAGDNTPYYVNIKIFINGSVQMTGLKSLEDGPRVIEHVIEFLRRFPVEAKVIPVDPILDVNGYEIHLMNSKFNVNFEIKRKDLLQVVNQMYGVRCFYDPCRYQGVKIQYFYKPDGPRDGICYHEKNCREHKKAKLSICRCITVFIFQSGCVIITGAQRPEQTIECYEFVCRMLKETMHLIIKPLLLPIKRKEVAVFLPSEKDSFIKLANIVGREKMKVR
jgi:TATA-box binding protein (TBP) (component of TFIID and TFIIIB)